MSDDICATLRRHFCLDGTQPEHPVRRAVEEIERLRAALAAPVEVTDRMVLEFMRVSVGAGPDEPFTFTRDGMEDVRTALRAALGERG